MSRPKMKSDKEATMKKKNTNSGKGKLKESSKFSSRKAQTNDNASDPVGIEYPLDLWFLISEHIQPEAVGIFASICKGSYQVVQTSKFWFHIYKRYYKPVRFLPERLKPECMVRRCGLRACAIRALHFIYFFPHHKLYRNDHFFGEDLYSLVNRQCFLMWNKKGPNRWFFYFKLKKIGKRCVFHTQLRNSHDHESDLFDVLEDVFENPEEDCRVLQVACRAYQMVPLVTGLILQCVKLDLSPGFEHYRLQLSFGNAYIPKSPTDVLVLNCVLHCKVLDWWHPGYPHQDRVCNPLPVMQSWESELSLN